MNPTRVFPTIVGRLLLAAGPIAVVHAQSGPAQVEFPRLSPAATVSQRIGLTDVVVEYSRPDKNGREVFGGLVPFNEVWRTGANESTKVSFSDPVKLGDTDVPAGKYALYTIPTPDQWMVILYKDTSLWGAFKYRQADDFARFTVRPETAATPTETFTIGFDDLKEDGATMVLAWDTVRVPVRLTVDTKGKVMAAIARATAPGANPPPTPRTLAQAADYYLSHDGDPAQALAWMNVAIEGRPADYSLYERKARLQAKLGDKPGAIDSAQQALKLVQAKPEQADPSEPVALRKFIDDLR